MMPYDNKKGKFETFVFIKVKYIALDYKRKIIKKKEYEKIKFSYSFFRFLTNSIYIIFHCKIKRELINS